MQLGDLKQWIAARHDEIEATLKHLVEINTYTTHTHGVDHGMDELARIAQGMGLTMQVVNGRHRLIKAGNETAKPRVLLISHMDTVFPPDGDFLHYERLSDGLVRGPGVGDIKGGLVMGLYAMNALRELHDDFDVQMVVSADEEKGSPTIRQWYLDGHVGADVAIGLEPGFPQGDLTADVPLGVVEQRRGYGAIRFMVAGKQSHSGVPQEGLSAAEALAQRITRLHALNDWDHGISVNVGLFSGGISPNTVAGAAEATVSFRYETMADGERTKAAVEEIISGQYVRNAKYDVWDSATMEVEAFIPPMEKSERNQKLVNLVLQEAQRLGQPVVAIKRGGGSDANFISGAGTPAICGMGAPTYGLHTPQEMIHLPMMFERINLLTSVLYRLVTAAA